ncbi:MAG: hypothetical protein FD180_1164 [Planctomycetota bacterium]|nr:MAG: hypothetical protein FD180_1164 [Planctomycetota bacterium]
MRLAIAPALLLAASVALAGDRDKKEKPGTIPPDFIHWAHSWEEAKAEAKERNVPIHVAFHKDG